MDAPAAQEKRDQAAERLRQAESGSTGTGTGRPAGEEPTGTAETKAHTEEKPSLPTLEPRWHEVVARYRRVVEEDAQFGAAWRQWVDEEEARRGVTRAQEASDEARWQALGDWLLEEAHIMAERERAEKGVWEDAARTAQQERNLHQQAVQAQQGNEQEQRRLVRQREQLDEARRGLGGEKMKADRNADGKEKELKGPWNVLARMGFGPLKREAQELRDKAGAIDTQILQQEEAIRGVEARLDDLSDALPKLKRTTNDTLRRKGVAEERRQAAAHELRRAQELNLEVYRTPRIRSPLDQPASTSSLLKGLAQDFPCAHFFLDCKLQSEEKERNERRAAARQSVQRREEGLSYGR